MHQTATLMEKSKDNANEGDGDDKEESKVVKTFEEKMAERMKS